MGRVRANVNVVHAAAGSPLKLGGAAEAVTAAADANGPVGIWRAPLRFLWTS